MQNYKVIHGNSSVKSSRTIINDDIQTAISNNSGTAFPTANLVEGMKCYRTDLKRTFTLVDVDTKKWEPDDAGGTAKTANKLTTARTINVTGKATGSAQFDGSADINLKLTTVNADTATTATVANSAKACTGNSVTASQVAWNGVIGKPSSYPPTAHNHDASYPSTTGARASGTWNINVTGTAGSVSWTNVQGRPGTLEPYYANNKWYAVGDDIYMGDHNIGGCLCLKSTNGTTGVALFQQSNDQNYASIKFDGSNLLVSHTVKGTITNASYANSAGNADTVDGWHRDDIRAWGNITGKPATATRWPAWDEVTGKPATATAWPSWDNVTSKPATATRWPSWGEITDKPSGLIKVASWDASSATLKLTT